MNADSKQPVPGSTPATSLTPAAVAASATEIKSSDVLGAAGPDDIVLPNAREVNRIERAKRQAEKARDEKVRSGVGIARNLMSTLEKKHAGDPRAQLSGFLAGTRLPAGTGRDREVSDKTRTDYRISLHQTLDDLASLRIHLHNLSDIRQRHIMALVKLWLKRDNATGTIAGRVSILRRFLTLIGRESILPKGKAWRELLKQQGIDTSATKRSHLPTMTAGWVDCNIDAAGVIESVRSEDAVAACILEMMWMFGLRFNEAVQFQPRVSDKGEYISVYRGTKGGKPREVRLSANAERRELQLAALQNAKALSDKHPRGILGTPGLKLAQTKNRLRHILRKHGVHKDDLGVTPHGLRHQFGTDLFRELCGLPAPVLGLVPHEVYVANAEKVRAAFLEVSRQMGHERPSISGAYLSTPQKMDRVADGRLADWLARLGTCGNAFVGAGVEEAWIVGKGAFGLQITDGAALQVAARNKTLDADSAAALQALSARLADAIGFAVTVNPWLATSRPEEGVEILFANSPSA